MGGDIHHQRVVRQIPDQPKAVAAGDADLGGAAGRAVGRAPSLPSKSMRLEKIKAVSVTSA